MDKEKLFRDAIREFGDRLYRICCCHILDAEDRKDAYQETLVHIWNGLGGFREGAQVSSWAYRIAVNTCLDHLRKTGRRKRILGTRIVTDDGDPLDDIPADAPPSPDERIDRLYACVEQLPPADRTVISLYLEDLSSSEMAGITGLTEGNVRTRVHRAKGLLKAMMNGAEDGHR
jgi:RNA polymerase sigma-70 factor (ECF subfamily)